MASIKHLFLQIIIVKHIQILSLFKQVHVHFHRLVQQLHFFGHFVISCVLNLINSEKVSISSLEADFRLLKLKSVFVIQLVDFVSKKFWYKLEAELFLDWKVVFDVVMENLQAFEYFWVVPCFLKYAMLNLVILYHTQNRYFLNSIDHYFLRKIFVTIKFFHQLVTIQFELIVKFNLCLALRFTLFFIERNQV